MKKFILENFLGRITNNYLAKMNKYKQLSSCFDDVLLKHFKSNKKNQDG